MQLYASYGHNFGAVGKLRISAFEWYQAHVLRIDINAIHGRLENSTSFTGSQAVFSEHFFHLPVLHLPVLWVIECDIEIDKIVKIRFSFKVIGKEYGSCCK